MVNLYERIWQPVKAPLFDDRLDTVVSGVEMDLVYYDFGRGHTWLSKTSPNYWILGSSLANTNNNPTINADHFGTDGTDFLTLINPNNSILSRMHDSTLHDGGTVIMVAEIPSGAFTTSNAPLGNNALGASDTGFSILFNSNERLLLIIGENGTHITPSLTGNGAVTGGQKILLTISTDPANDQVLHSINSSTLTTTGSVVFRSGGVLSSDPITAFAAKQAVNCETGFKMQAIATLNKTINNADMAKIKEFYERRFNVSF